MPKAKKVTRKPRTKRSKKAGSPKAATGGRISPAQPRPLGGMPGADGLPPAPLEKLRLEETNKRLKAIIGGQSGENPSQIDDGSPVIRPNILWTRLRSAINRHFFPAPLNGIVGFPSSETVIACARRIKRTRDPQTP
jgi:hypothetical protein